MLTEKLMGHSVHECKEMGRVAKITNKHLVTGHQRHYSILYDNAVDTIRRGLLGDIHSIRQWHRDNMPGTDSWQVALPDDKMAEQIAKLEKELETAKGSRMEAISKKLEILKHQYADHVVNAADYGYQEATLNGGYKRSASKN